MKRFLGISLTFLVVAGFVLLVIGCGGSPDKGNGSTAGTLTKDKQFDELDDLVNMDFDSDEALFDMSDIIYEQTASPYWDGVDSSDVFSDAVLASPQLSALGKVGQLQEETFSMLYNPQSGWWVIYYYAMDEFWGFEVEIRDSVRFETLSGTPQEEPDASTYRVRESGFADLAWNLSGDSGSFNLDFETQSHQDVTGLNSSVVSVAGGASGNFSAFVDNTSENQSMDMNFSFNGVNHDVTVSSPQLGVEACPTGGSATADFSLSIDVQDGGQHESASGNWDVDVVFLGNGQATINVQSGDFAHSATGDICP